MTPSEFGRYCDLLIADPLLYSYAETLSNRFEEDIETEVDKRSRKANKEETAEKIAERLEEVADGVDTLEEAIIASVKFLPYNELVDRIEELFERFNEKQNFRDD